MLIELSKNNTLEVTSYLKPKLLLDIAFFIKDNTFDHKGFDLTIRVFGLGFSLSVYDNRHAEEY